MSLERLSVIEARLSEHNAVLSELKETSARHGAALQELSRDFGNVLGELGEVRRAQVEGRAELVGAIGHLADGLAAIDAALKEFRAAWKATCDERHKHVDFRLARAEGAGDQALQELDDMSEQSKVNYILDLESRLKKREVADEQSRKNLWKFVTAIVTGLLTGGVGVAVVQWLLKG